VSDLDAFLAAAPQPQRSSLRMLLALARRPKGRLLLGRSATLAQLTDGLLAMEHYEEPAAAKRLGWDAQAVTARGRALRRAEGRP
jgi:hypothetical protein